MTKSPPSDPEPQPIDSVPGIDAPFCSHKFVDSKHCLKCGVHIDTLREQAARELKELRGG